MTENGTETTEEDLWDKEGRDLMMSILMALLTSYIFQAISSALIGAAIANFQSIKRLAQESASRTKTDRTPVTTPIQATPSPSTSTGTLTSTSYENRNTNLNFPRKRGTWDSPFRPENKPPEVKRKIDTRYYAQRRRDPRVYKDTRLMRTFPEAHISSLYSRDQREFVTRKCRLLKETEIDKVQVKGSVRLTTHNITENAIMDGYENTDEDVQLKSVTFEEFVSAYEVGIVVDEWEEINEKTASAGSQSVLTASIKQLSVKRF